MFDRSTWEAACRASCACACPTVHPAGPAVPTPVERGSHSAIEHKVERKRGVDFLSTETHRTWYMTIKVGDKLPEGELQEFVETETEGCSLGPNTFKVQDLTKGKKIVIFGLPGAYTPTCSAKHVPGYVQQFDALKAKGVDEVWCLSVNDAFVMGAWGRDQKTGGKVRMMADGSAAYTKKL